MECREHNKMEHRIYEEMYRYIEMDPVISTNLFGLLFFGYYLKQRGSLVCLDLTEFVL